MRDYLTQVVRASFGRDRRQHVRQVLRTKVSGRLQVVEIRVDFHAASTTASANGLVSLANMRWLHELGCHLQKVAINREWSLEQPSGWHKPRLTSPFVFL